MRGEAETLLFSSSLAACVAFLCGLCIEWCTPLHPSAEAVALWAAGRLGDASSQNAAADGSASGGGGSSIVTSSSDASTGGAQAREQAARALADWRRAAAAGGEAAAARHGGGAHHHHQRPHRHITSAADVWSAGCVVYELLFGEALFQGPDMEVARDVLSSASDAPLRLPGWNKAGEEVSAAAAAVVQARGDLACFLANPLPSSH